MAFIRKKSDPRGWPQISQEHGFFYVSGAFLRADLKARAEALCSALNRRQVGSAAAMESYVMTPVGLRLAPRDADDNLRAQMDLICGGDRKSAKARAHNLRTLLETEGEACACTGSSIR